MNIYPIKTGAVKVKQAQKSRQSGGMLRVLTSDEWTEWLPIYAWLIKHPEGNILVDTGETAKTSDPDYFTGWHPYYHFAVKMDVSRDEEIDHQLTRYDLEPHDIDKVILTHFHTDHAGGLYHFPQSKILVPATDYREAKGMFGKLKGYLPQHWSPWFNPMQIEFKNQPYGSFNKSYKVTHDGSITIVPTPGHTPGHVSVVADTGNEKFFLAGDTSYNQDLLIHQQADGVSPNPSQSIDTHKRILKMAAEEPVVYLPSHDPESVHRLQSKKALDIASNYDN